MLFLTARDAAEDRGAGVTAGGDDYVTKPFSIRADELSVAADTGSAGWRPVSG